MHSGNASQRDPELVRKQLLLSVIGEKKKASKLKIGEELTVSFEFQYDIAY